MAVAGAQAADLPVKAKPVEYVKICSLYGDGFYYIPGTDTCLRLAGNAQFELGHAANGDYDPIYNGTAALRTRDSPDIMWRARGELDADVRTQTAYGTLRAFTRFRTDQKDAGNNADNTTGPGLPRAFVQWAGFTVGRVKSLADSTVLGDEGMKILVRGGNFHGDTGSSGTIEFAYSWELGNGMSLHVGGGERRVSSYSNLSTAAWAVPGTNPASSIAGQVAPTPFVAFKVNQAWGQFNIAGAVQQLRGLYYTAATPGFASCTGGNTGTTFCDAPDDKWGWAVQGGTIIHTPWIGQGDNFAVYAAYSQGALAYAIGGNSATAGLYGSGNAVALGAKTDAVFINGQGFQLTTAWVVNGGYIHYWNPQLATSFWGNHWEISYDDTVVNNRWFCGGGGAVAQGILVSAATRCDPGYKLNAVGITTNWYPAPSFRIGVEVMYVQVQTAFDGSIITLAKNGGRPSGAYTAKDEGSLNAVLRVQRQWPPSGGE